MEELSKFFTKWLLILLVSFGALEAKAQQDLTAVSLQARASADHYPDEIQEKQDSKSLLIALKELEKKYQVFFAFQGTLLKDKQVKVSEIRQGTLDSELNSILAPHQLTYQKSKVDDYYIIRQKENPKKTSSLLKLERSQLPQPHEQRSLLRLASRNAGINLGSSVIMVQNISGKITDGETGEGLPGVNVLAKGTTQGTVTDVDGNYRITVPDNVNTLTFSSIGYVTQEISINGRSNINVGLSPDVQALDEVVVVGYGTVQKSDLTGSVSSVKAEELSAYPAGGTVQALQGRAAGVQIQSNNGEPGGDLKVRVRGGTSINASSDPIFVVDGFVGAALPPPEDIASIEVLKDASATAIYGSRGANGVIMVTTKRGKAGKTNISLSASYSGQNEINRLDLLNADDYTNYIQEVKPNFQPGDANTDWQDVIFRPGDIENYQLSVSGGNEAVRYYLSGTYFDQEGIIIGSNYNRLSLTSNIDVNASDKLRLGVNLFARREAQDGTRTQEGSGGQFNTGVVASAFKFGPDQGIYNPDGSFTIANTNDPHDNPFAIATQQINESEEDRLQVNTYLEYDILESLQFRATLGASTNNERIGEYTPTTLNSGRGVGGRGEITNRRNTLFLSENYLTYSRTFNDIHELNILGGYSYQKNTDENFSGAGQSFVTDAGLYYDLDGSAEWLRPASGLTEWELTSFYGRANYSLLEKYLFTFNARYDGSSTFSRNNKWAFFPSGAVAWNIKKEQFLQDANWLSFLKLRGSYGLTGNRAISPYQTLAQFSPILTIINGVPVNAVGPTAVANDNLTWETTAQLDIGADIGLFDDRVNITVDWYRMETTDLLFSVPLPEYSGYGSQIKNIGSVENKGFEFTLNSRNLSGDFIWDMDLNFSLNRNRILELPEGNEIPYSSGPGHIVGLGDTQILREGEPVGSFFGFIYDGVYQEGDEFIEGGGFEQEAGGERFRDVDGIRDADGNLTGEADGILNNSDRTIIGNPNPDFIWGFNNNFKWRGFDLNVFFQASQGNDILSYTLMELDLLAGQNNATVAALDRWTPTNTDTDVPKATAGRSRRVSTRWIYDGSFIRLKNLALGYNLPPSVLEAINISKLRVYVSAQNILTFTEYEGYDPEVNYRTGGGTNGNRNLGLDYGSYPNAKSYTVGLNLTF